MCLHDINSFSRGVQRQQAVVEAQFQRRTQLQSQVVRKQPGADSISPQGTSVDHYTSPHRPPPKGPTGSHMVDREKVPSTAAAIATAGVEESFTYDCLPGVEKTCLGISSRVYGDQDLMILSKAEIQMLEDALPIDMQVDDGHIMPICTDTSLVSPVLRLGVDIQLTERRSQSGDSAARLQGQPADHLGYRGCRGAKVWRDSV